MELKQFTDKQLAERIVDYIERAMKLKNKICSYSPLSESRINDEYIIRREYEELKNQIREDANYVDLKRNNNPNNKLYSEIFSKSIKEAAAYGFKAAVNAKINQDMSIAVDEAIYYLKKYKSIDDWRSIASAE